MSEGNHSVGSIIGNTDRPSLDPLRITQCMWSAFSFFHFSQSIVLEILRIAATAFSESKNVSGFHK